MRIRRQKKNLKSNQNWRKVIQRKRQRQLHLKQKCSEKCTQGNLISLYFAASQSIQQTDNFWRTEKHNDRARRMQCDNIIMPLQVVVSHEQELKKVVVDFHRCWTRQSVAIIVLLLRFRTFLVYFFLVFSLLHLVWLTFSRASFRFALSVFDLSCTRLWAKCAFQNISRVTRKTIALWFQLSLCVFGRSRLIKIDAAKQKLPIANNMQHFSLFLRFGFCSVNAFWRRGKVFWLLLATVDTLFEDEK